MELPVIEGNLDDSVQEQREALTARLRGSIEGEVRTDRHHCRLYATDASLYQVEPIAVVTPRVREDIAVVVSACAALGLPVLGRGAGTSLAGQTVAHAVVMDCSVHLDGIAAVQRYDGGGGEVMVEPGVVLDALQEQAGRAHLGFGPDVSTSTHATLGGMIMNCSAGARSLIYGMTDEHVLGLDVVLSDGTRLHLDEGAALRDSRVHALTERLDSILRPLADEIDQRFPKTRRNVGGYALDDLLAQFRASTPGQYEHVNLSRLICGSEGTLAFLERARLRLVDLPTSECTALVRFESIAEAMEAVVPILETRPVAIELIDEHIIQAAGAQRIYAQDVEKLRFSDGRMPKAVLYVSWFDDAVGESQRHFAALESVVSKEAVLRLERPEDAQRLWAIRKVGLGLISKAQGTLIPMPGLEDCAVGAEQLASFIHEFDALFARYGRDAVHYAHASVGLLHLRPRFDVASAKDRDDFLAMGHEALEIVQAHGGSISGEHGDGRIRSELTHKFYGERLVQGFRDIKNLFDPDNRFNPGDKVEVRDPMGSLRSAYVTGGAAGSAPQTYFAYQQEGSFAEATAACDGNGLCRRKQGGAMCPSYRVTKEEQHTTRGRANALDAAIRGELSFDDAELQESLSLCLSCKACRHECPSNVDMSRLKAEYTARRWETERPGLKNRLMGQMFDVLNRNAARVPWLANAVSQMAPTRWLLSQLLGVATERSLPRYARPLQQQIRSHRTTVSDDAPVVLLFPDCFTNCNDPLHGLAAAELLEAFGYRVVVPQGALCCGRAAISGGFLPKAVELMHRSIEGLWPIVEQEGVQAVLALEPSCASALQEDWVEFRDPQHRSERERLAAMTDVFEGFLLNRWEQHPRRPDFVEPVEELMIHQHCHMKHTGQQLGSLVERCLGQSVPVVDSGCCGMAGSFGYRKENQAVSRAIAEDSLGRFVRGFEGTVLAPGTSCREQLCDVFNCRVVHPVVYLRDHCRPVMGS